MIKKIIHTADWHLEPYKNHKRFQDSIDAFIASVDKEIGHLDYEESRLVIVGDLFDNRSKEPSNEAFSIMFKTLKRLSEKYKTIVTIGNHDYDVNNKSKMDCITPVYETFKELGWDYEITYLKHSCIFEDNNVVFCNYSNYDGNLRPDIEKSLEENPDKVHIGLFHDVVQGSTNFFDYDLTQHHEGVTTPDVFKGCDFVMMGDIHKHQVIKYKVPVAYCGSLYQLNFGETVKGHGYLLWDVDTKKFKFKEVDIPHALYKVKIDSFEEALSGNFKFVNE